MAIITSKIEDSKKESLINPNEQADNQTHNSYSNSNSSIFPQNERLTTTSTTTTSTTTSSSSNTVNDQSELQKKLHTELDNLSVLSPDHLPTLQPISQEVFTPPSSYPDVTSVTSSVSSAISLFTNCNFSTESMKIKEESEVSYPLELSIDHRDNNYSIQNSNNFLNDQINNQYQRQQNHSSQNESNLTRIATVDYLKRHPCTYRGCGKVFFSRTSLIYHKQSHAIDKPYMCTYPSCGITFCNEALLKTHIQLHEPKQLRERFSCTLPGCNKVFVTRECLIEHIRIHTGERPFICDYPGCTHRFARRCNLFAHKRVHLDKNQRRQYHCIHAGCGKTFLYSRSLTEHMNVHLGERPYVCDYPGCEKSFTSKSYLYAHRRIHLSGIDKSNNSTCSSSSINQQFDSTITTTTTNNNNIIPPIPVTVTIPVLQPIHYPFSQSIITNKQQLQQQQQQHHQQQLQQQQQRIQSQLQHPLLSNTNIHMPNNIPAHLFYSTQQN
uniref:Zinc finger protein 143 n=1 Tax=Schistosoma japonicum TaxID=6182 RepID=C1LDW3_SCHJA|nr:Zinc finger protein 143 [Schistosoma japonicum]